MLMKQTVRSAVQVLGWPAISRASREYTVVSRKHCGMRLPAVHNGSCMAVAMYKTPNLVGEKEVLVATSYKDLKTWNWGKKV